MIAVYAIATLLGLVALVAWILTASLGGRLDPETRFGIGGRRVVAGVAGFGLAGMAAAYSPLDPPVLVEVVVAAGGAAVAVWYAGWSAPGG